jgi:hypothetical protein
MILGIFCIISGLCLIYQGIQVIKARLTYWVMPTFMRIQREKYREEQQDIGYDNWNW